MPHCTKCGAEIADHASFCASCGAPQSAVSPTAAPPASSAAPTQQMAENIAGLLCYVLGWITGLIFYFVDKRPYVRFHAAQSIVVFGGLHIIEILLSIFFGVGMFMSGVVGGFSMAWALSGIVGLVVFVLWILLMVKAYQGERFRVPIAADIAEKIFGKT